MATGINWLDALITGVKNISNSGTLLPTRSGLNFTTGLTATDNPTTGNTDVSSTAGSASNVLPLPIAGAASAGSDAALSRDDHVHAHGAQAAGDGTNHAGATVSIAGFMTPAQVAALAAITPSTATPLVLSGTGVTGTGTNYSREDHQHPLTFEIAASDLSAKVVSHTGGTLTEEGASSVWSTTTLGAAQTIVYSASVTSLFDSIAQAGTARAGAVRSIYAQKGNTAGNRGGTMRIGGGAGATSTDTAGNSCVDLGTPVSGVTAFWELEAGANTPFFAVNQSATDTVEIQSLIAKMLFDVPTGGQFQFGQNGVEAAALEFSSAVVTLDTLANQFVAGPSATPSSGAGRQTQLKGQTGATVTGTTAGTNGAGLGFYVGLKGAVGSGTPGADGTVDFYDGPASSTSLLSVDFATATTTTVSSPGSQRLTLKGASVLVEDTAADSSLALATNSATLTAGSNNILVTNGAIQLNGGNAFISATAASVAAFFAGTSIDFGSPLIVFENTAQSSVWANVTNAAAWKLAAGPQATSLAFGGGTALANAAGITTGVSGQNAGSVSSGTNLTGGACQIFGGNKSAGGSNGVNGPVQIQNALGDFFQGVEIATGIGISVVGGLKASPLTATEWPLGVSGEVSVPNASGPVTGVGAGMTSGHHPTNSARINATAGALRAQDSAGVFADISPTVNATITLAATNSAIVFKDLVTRIVPAASIATAQPIHKVLAANYATGNAGAIISAHQDVVIGGSSITSSYRATVHVLWIWNGSAWVAANLPSGGASVIVTDALDAGSFSPTFTTSVASSVLALSVTSAVGGTPNVSVSLSGYSIS